MSAPLLFALASVVVTLGCTSDHGASPPPVSCGDGTMLKGSQCVPSYYSGFAGMGGAGGATVLLGCSKTDGPCHQCVSTSCGSACSACQAVPDCVAKVDCLEKCNNDTCAAGCAELYPLGAMAFESFDACLANSCAKACSSGGAGSAGAAGTSGGLCAGGSTDPCDQCGTQHCASACSACAAVPDCVAQVGCLGTCSDQVCVAMCANTYPAGDKALAGFAMCLKASCAKECGGGSGGSGGTGGSG